MRSLRFWIPIVIGSLIGGLILFFLVGDAFSIYSNLTEPDRLTVCSTTYSSRSVYGFPFEYADIIVCGAEKSEIMTRFSTPKLALDLLLYILLPGIILYRRANRMSFRDVRWQIDSTRLNGPDTDWLPRKLNMYLAFLVAAPYVCALFILRTSQSDGLSIGIAGYLLTLLFFTLIPLAIGWLSTKSFIMKFMNVVLWEGLWLAAVSLLGGVSPWELTSVLTLPNALFLISHGMSYLARKSGESKSNGGSFI